MPTGRAYAFLVAMLLLYVFANQTQVGWLYVMAALLAGVLLAGFGLNRRALNGLTAEHQINESNHLEAHEGDPAHVRLKLCSQRNFAAVQLTITERCPLAPPDERETQLFAPILRDQLTHDYTIQIDRRGVYRFQPITIETRAPFGFFHRRRMLPAPAGALIFPEMRPIKRFALFEQQVAAQMVYPRSGIGTEVIGTRPYRPGDSPRHIHWRSVARRPGQLISKEFAEETRPGVTLVLDRYYPGDVTSKHNPFEWAIKCAVSIADYTRQRNYPLHLLADPTDLPTPGGAVAWDGLMQYMARVEPTTNPALPDLLTGHHLQRFVVVVVAWPDDTLVEALISLKHRGYGVTAVIMQTESYPDETLPSSQNLLDGLTAAGVDTISIAYDTDWTEQLAASIV